MHEYVTQQQYEAALSKDWAVASVSEAAAQPGIEDELYSSQWTRCMDMGESISLIVGEVE